MREKRFTKLMGYIRDNTFEGGDVEGVMDLTEIEDMLNKLYEENRELNSIKRFAERNGINIFLIEEAFRKCWKDNGKLFEENEKLKFENETLKSNYQKEIKSSIDFCNAYSKTNDELLEEIEKLEQKIKDKNTYQRVLEAKIRRLKDRIKVLEKNGVKPRL